METKRSRLLLLLCLVFGAAQNIGGATNSTISFSTSDLTILVNESIPFDVIVPASALNSTVVLSFETNHVNNIAVDQRTLALTPSDVDERHPINLIAHHPGRYVISVKVEPNDLINVSRLFVRVIIAYSHEFIQLSTVAGWIYTAAWAFSFWPQIIANFQRKSVVGFNFDFVALSTVGQTLYCIFNVGVYFSSSIENEYWRRHPTGQNPVKFNDVIFSLHSVLGCTIFVIQCCIFERGGQAISRTIGWIMAGFALILAVCGALATFNVIHWFDFLMYCSYVNLAISLMKYTPQVIMNYRRKSTTGFSIYGIFADLTGGIFSMLQMLFDGYNFDDFGSIFGDPAKFGLGLITAAFDLLIIFQHFILYPHKYAVASKTEPILKC